MVERQTKVVTKWCKQRKIASHAARSRFGTGAAVVALSLIVVPSGYAQTTPSQGGLIRSRPSLSSREIAEVYSEGQTRDAEEQRASSSPEQGRAGTREINRPGKATEDVAREAAEESGGEADGTSKPDEEIRRLVEQLGSSEFAERERASAELYAAGSDALPELRKVAESAGDLEVRLRAQDVAEGIVSGEVAGRIDEFLAGGAAPAPGWPIIQQIFGDGVRVRELFVELSLRHTEVLAALESTTRQREQTFETLLSEVKQGMFLEGKLPTGVNAVALLLLANDPDVVLSNVDEETLLSILRRKGDNQLDREPQLAKPYRALVGGWVLRSNLINRVDVLAFTRDQSIPEGLELAERTLEASNDVYALAAVLQTIVRFGDESHIQAIEPLLQDQRVINNQFFARAGELEVQVRDAAAAALVVLHEKSLSDFGMKDEAHHPLAGLVLDRLALPKESPEQRRQILQKVEALSGAETGDDASDPPGTTE